ncbi:DUF4351 domain-containing protein [Duganella guangzhouensis]|nr:DUF4351 domain-containing protein [Duganella guangzhouensis]
MMKLDRRKKRPHILVFPLNREIVQPHIVIRMIDAASFFADVGPEIDWRKRPRFRDKELAGLSFGSATDSMVADKLVEVCWRDGGTQWLLIHIEVQAQRDATLGRRVLDYNYRIFKEHERPVSSLVVLADEDVNWRPCSFHSRAPRTVMGIDFGVVKLLDYAANSEELLASHNPFAWLTLAHLRTQQARHDPDVLYAAKWQCTKQMYRHGWRKERILAMFQVINWMMVLPEQHQRRYWQAVLELDKEYEMKLLNPLEQMFLDDGIKKGLEQGLAQGRQEGASALLERLLIRRFGPLPDTAKSRLAKASLRQLEAWSDALPEAESLRQVFAKRPAAMG